MIQNCFVVFHAMKLQFSFGNMGVGLAIMADPLERCSTPAIKYERTKERVKKKKIHKTAERSRRFSETASPFAKTGFPRKKKPKKKMTKKNANADAKTHFIAAQRTTRRHKQTKTKKKCSYRRKKKLRPNPTPNAADDGEIDETVRLHNLEMPARLRKQVLDDVILFFFSFWIFFLFFNFYFLLLLLLPVSRWPPGPLSFGDWALVRWMHVLPSGL